MGQRDDERCAAAAQRSCQRRRQNERLRAEERKRKKKLHRKNVEVDGRVRNKKRSGPEEVNCKKNLKLWCCSFRQLSFFLFYHL